MKFNINRTILSLVCEADTKKKRESIRKTARKLKAYSFVREWENIINSNT